MALRTLPLVFLAFLMGKEAIALSCDCSLSPCVKPQCCDTKNYVPDPCNCCQVCAQGEGEKCGGPWNIEGLCSDGLHCFRKCQCKAKKTRKPCVFPFKYKDVLYNECTSVDTADGNAWCAIVVDDATRNVKEEYREPCSESCPGMNFPCSESDLFNIAGTCVTDEKRDEIEGGAESDPFTFDTPVASALRAPAPSCKKDSVKTADGGVLTCRCTDALERGQEGNCRPGQLPGAEWCYVEYVINPAAPKQSCFDDVKWSESAGMFWSSKACQTEVDQ